MVVAIRHPTSFGWRAQAMRELSGQYKQRNACGHRHGVSGVGQQGEIGHLHGGHVPNAGSVMAATV